MKLTKSILLTSCFFLLCACGEYKLESEENETVQDEQTEARYTLQLNVTSRNNAKINYPLSLFLFDDENNCVVRETIPTEESEFSSSISKGSIHSSCYLASTRMIIRIRWRLFPTVISVSRQTTARKSLCK